MHGRTTITLAAAILLAPLRSSGQPGSAAGGEGVRAEGAASAAVVPPRLRTAPGVPYPDGASGEARVVLAVTVSADGSVAALRVVEGGEPFASAALAAARAWGFEPATRGGRPLAALVRVEVRFVPPAPATAPEPAQGSAASEPAARPPAPPQPPPIEVLVLGERPAEPAVATFSRSEVRQLPGAFGDPFRAIEVMPGVTPVLSGLPYFYVRGAPPGNVGYFLDGVRVPQLFHFALGPSVVHPALVERVDLHPGGYPARFGRYAGAVVAAETTPASRDLQGEASIRIFDAGGMIEGPVSERATLLLGGRYSYTAAALSLLAPDSSFGYWDYQARAAVDLSARDRATVFAFGSHDTLGQRNDASGEMETILALQFHRLDLRLDRRLDEAGEVRFAVALGHDRSLFSEEDGVELRDRSVGGRVELRRRLSPALILRLGADSTFEHHDVIDRGRREEEDELKAFEGRSDVTIGAYLDLVAEVAPGFEVVPGLRVDYFVSGGASAVGLDPRFASRLEVARGVRLVQAHGVAHQPPSFVIPLPGLTLPGLKDGLQRSVQTSAGVEVDLPHEVTASATLFQNGFFEMSDLLGSAREGSDDFLGGRSLGAARGFELSLKRRLTRDLGGFLAYTLSRSLRTVDGATFVSNVDRTHVLHAALGYNLGRSFRAGTRFSFYTGVPRYERDGRATPERDASPERLPSFHRVDVRLEKRWRIVDGKGWIAFVAEMLNATLQKEVVSESCDSLGRCRYEEVGPIAIPSLGVEAGF